MDPKESLADLIRKNKTATDQFIASYDARVDGLQDRVEDLEAKRGQPGATISGKKLAVAMKSFAESLHTGGEAKEMSIAGGAAAGEALVPELIASDILARALAQSRLASIVQTTNSDTSDYVRLLNLRGQTAVWSFETGTRSDTASFQLREIRPTHGELYSVVPVTNWLLQDSQFDVAGVVVENAVEQFAKALELAIYSGDGSDKPTGLVATTPVLTADSASPERAATALQYIVGSGDLANDIISLYFTLKPEYRANATFVMSSASLAVVRQLRDSNGSGFLWQQNLSQAMDAPDGLLMGRPVIT